MRRLSRLFLMCLLLALTVAAFGQNIPGPVNTALNDLNNQTGGSYVLGSSVAYQFREELFNGNNLGCSSVANTAPGEIRGFVVLFDTGFDGDYEWEYRVSSDSSIVIVCRRPVAPQPTTEPGPARPTATPSNCSPLHPRIGIGSQGRILPPQPNVMRATPARAGEYVTDIAVGGVVTILDGPRCAGTFTWWQVDYNGTIGWTVESDGSEYWIEPFDPNASATPEGENTESTGGPVAEVTPVICDPALPPRLARNEIGRVSPGYANNLRAQPLRSGEKVGEIPGGQTFTVLDGPQCGDGLTWWFVAYNGVNGWTVEGQSGEYFLIPPTPHTAITLDNSSTLTPFATFTAPKPLTKVVLANRMTIQTIDEDGYHVYTRQNPLDAGAITYSETNTVPGQVADFVTLPNGLVQVALLQPDSVIVALANTDSGSPIAASGVVSAKFNAAGTLLATITEENALTVWDIDPNSATNGQAVLSFDADGSPLDIAFTPTGIVIAYDNLIALYTIANGASEEQVILVNDLYNQQIAAGRGGKWLAVVGTTQPDNTAKASRLFDLEAQVRRFGSPGEGAEFISRPALLPDELGFAMLDTMGDISRVRFTEIQLGDIISAITVPFAGEVTFNENGTLMAVYNPETGDVQLFGIAN